MDVAAGIVGFIGLTGQVLQGCNHLSNLLSNAKDAPEIIKDVSSEIEAVQDALQHFNRLLSELDRYPHLIPENWNPASALKMCENAIEKLKSFINNFRELDAQNAVGTAISPRMRTQRRWRKMKLANNVDKLHEHVSHLQSAKQALQLLHLSIGSNIGLTSHLYVEKQSENLQQSMEKLSIQGTKAQDTSDTMLRSVQHLTAASNDTQAELLEMRSDVSQRLDSLPLPNVFSSMVKAAVVEALAEHATQTSRESRVQPERRAVEELDPHHVDGSDLSGQESPLTVDSHSHSLDGLPSQTSDDQSPGIQSPIRRSGKRQRSSESSYNTWFGRVIITTTITEQDEEYLPQPDRVFKLTAKRTMITLLPNIWFSNWGAKFQMGTTKPTNNHPLWDNRLRVFRTHLEDSPVDQVLRTGNFLEFRNMLERREVTPFDMVEDHSNDGKCGTLFEKALQELHHAVPIPHWKAPREAQGLFHIAKLLAYQGTDCGLGWSMYYVQLLAEASALRDTVALDLYYTILSYSETNPFESRTERIDTYSIRSFLAQDQWDLCDAQEQFESTYGKESWAALVLKRKSSYQWHVEQDNVWFLKERDIQLSKDHCLTVFGAQFVKYRWPQLCWKQEVPSFWRSKKQCEEFFGKRFVDMEWPQLYWEQERPLLWRSKQYCEQFFGEAFMIRKWPQLYWNQEVPSFWRSRKQCEEFFGEWFVEENWPRLYWEQEVPSFWFSPQRCKEVFGGGFVTCDWIELLGKSCFEYVYGHGAWEHCKRHRFLSRRRRDKWIENLRQKWRSQDRALRHSRSHNITEFGIELVKYHLSDLLWIDGLNEEEIEELTKDGEDMYCRPPQWPRKNEGDSWDEEEGREEHQINVAQTNNSRTGDDNNANSHDDLDSEDSGWETADEGDFDAS